MLIYIIEDNYLKTSKLLSFFSEHCPQLSEPLVYSSFHSGLKAIEELAPALVVLDMTLPTFDRKPNSREGRARPLGGYDLMRKMVLKKIHSKVVVVTQLESFGEGDEEVSFGDITSRCEREFSDIFLGSVYFDQSGTSWGKQLQSIVKPALGMDSKC